MIKKRGMHRKAQVVIFIVLSLSIILLGLLYFFYQKQYADKKVEILHPDVAVIKDYIDNCIRSVAEDGLERIGLSGGYIYLPEKIKNDPRTYLTTFPGVGFKIPYWWHDGIEAVPTEEFISQQLRSHIKNEIRNCVDRFRAFERRLNVTELREPVVDVQFNENDISINLKYPIEITSKDGAIKTNLESFEYTLPIRFKKVYELAKLIIERENKDYFLEKKTIDLYSIDSDIPTTDIEAGCKTKVWQLRAISNKLKTLLRVNLPYIKIKGTDYNPNLYVPNPSGKSVYSETYFGQHYVWEIDKDADTKYKNMKVAFTYDDKWPLDIYARPSQNGILSSDAQKGTDLLSFLCIQLWHFTYDIKYPVIVTIFDQNTTKNKNYRFSFAFKASIDHNQPSRLRTGTTLFETEPDLSSEDYCNTVQNEITIFTINNATGESIKDVNLTFVCGRYYCDIGQSDWISFGAAAGITKRFPYCVNGVIKGTKQGFAELKSFIQTEVDGSSYVLSLNPTKEFKNYKVVKHLLSNPSIVQELEPNEKASIQIKGKDTGFESFTVYPKEVDFPLIIPEGIDAVYEVNIYVIDEENIIGGYIGDWQVSKTALRTANEVVFHVIAQDGASEDDRAFFVSGLSSYSKKVPSPDLI